METQTPTTDPTETRQLKDIKTLPFPISPWRVYWPGFLLLAGGATLAALSAEWRWIGVALIVAGITFIVVRRRRILERDYSLCQFYALAMKGITEEPYIHAKEELFEASYLLGQVGLHEFPYWVGLNYDRMKEDLPHLFPLELTDLNSALHFLSYRQAKEVAEIMQRTAPKGATVTVEATGRALELFPNSSVVAAAPTPRQGAKLVTNEEGTAFTLINQENEQEYEQFILFVEIGRN
jgi:hypothetical protein